MRQAKCSGCGKYTWVNEFTWRLPREQKTILPGEYCAACFDRLDLPTCSPDRHLGSTSHIREEAGNGWDDIQRATEEDY